MASDPKPSMDALLKACAQRRREAITEPLEMHPATRSLLQQEVARVYATEPVPTEAKSKGWREWWPGLAWAGGVLAVTILLFVVVRPDRPSSRMEVALSKDQPRGGAAGERALLEDKPPAVYTPAPASPATATAITPPQARPEERPPGAVLPEVKSRLVRAETMAGQGLTNQVRPSLRARYGLSNIPTSQPVVVASRPATPTRPIDGLAKTAQQFETDRLTQKMESSEGQRFQQVNLRAKYRRNLNSPQLPRIMETFRIEQKSAGEIRIIDQDGSIYEGNIQSVSIPRAYAFSVSPRREPAELMSNVASQPALPPDGAAEGWRHYQFEARGTSQALGQAVVFQGTYSVADPAFVAGQAGGPASAKVQVPTLSSPQARVLGTLNIAGTNQLPVEANLVGP